MSTVWDVERTLEVLHPLAREVTGRELRPDDAATIADHVVTLIETGEPPECYGCEDTDRLEAVRQVLLNDWPAELAPELREQIRAAIHGD